MVRTSVKQLCPVSHLPMSRLQKACSACACSSIRATRPAIARAQRVNCTAGMNERKCIRTERESLSSWWPKQGNTAAGQEYSGTPIPHIQTLQRATRIRSRRAIREEFLEKNDVAGFRYVASSNPGYVGATSPDFSLLKYRPPILRHFRCGARGARCPYARTHPWCRTMESRRTG